MNAPGFRQLRDDVFRLHAAGRYADALALVEREGERHPNNWSELLFWRACLMALLGNSEGALDCLSEAIERGHWWSESALRSDPDLGSLQGDARFEALVSVCRQRHQEAQATARPELLVLSPDSPPPWPLLLALHGAGGTAKAWANDWVKAVDEGWLVGLPQSSQVLTPGGYGWGDRDRAAREVRQHYQILSRDYPVDTDRVVLGGFSQGGAMAIWVALSGLLPARGVLGLACAPRDLDEVRAAVRHQPVNRLRMYLVVGSKDHLFERAKEFSGVIRQAGMAVCFDERPGLGHGMPDDFPQTLATALDFLLSD